MHREQNVKLRDWVLMIIGATLAALGTRYINDPAGLVTGGVTGLSIVVRQVSGDVLGWEIPLWVSNFVLNVPIILFAIRTYGWKSIRRTAFVWLLYTAELMVLPERRLIPDDLLLTALYGSIFFGLSGGLLLTARATSGGSDLLGNTLHHYFPALSVGRLIQFADWTVVLLGTFVFGIEHTLYAILSVYVMGRVVDMVLNLGKTAKMAMIFSEKSDEIADEILHVMDRGVTGIPARGMYTGADRMMLLCICSNRDLVDIKEIVKRIDKDAFFIVNHVSEALGEGFYEEWIRAS